MVRFFSGGRSGKKMGAAAEAYKAGLVKKEGPQESADEKHKRMIEGRIAKMQEEYMLGNKKHNKFALSGTKQEDDKPKELSPRAKEMLLIMAQRKAQKERKKEKNKIDAWNRQERAKKAALLAAKLAAEQTQLTNAQEAEYQRQQAEYYAQQQAADLLLQQQQAEAEYYRNLADSSSSGGNGWW
jgi:hypothetical protein